MTTWWVGVDLDGTLATYDGWRGEDHVGEPIALMVQRVKDWIAAGVQVRVFTARVSGPDPEQVARARARVERWCDEHIGETLPVTCVKDFSMAELWDDRAVQVEENTGVALGRPRKLT